MTIVKRLGAFALIALAAATLTSCGGADERAKMIPSTEAVGVVNLMNIVDAVDYDNVKEMSMFKMAKGALAADQSEEGKLMSDVMDDPRTTGVEFDAPTYIYPAEVGDADYLVVSLALADADAFGQFVETMAGAEPTSEGGLSIVVVDDAAIGWSDGFALVVNSMGYSSDEELTAAAVALSKPLEEGSMASNDDFNSFVGETSQIGVWMDASSEMVEEMSDEMDLPPFMALEGEGTAHMFLDFNEGEIVLRAVVNGNETMKESLNYVEGDVSTDLIETLIGANAAIGVSLNMEKILGMKDVESQLGQAAAMVGVSEDELKGMLGGDVVLALTGENEEGAATWAVLASVEDAETAGKIFEMLDAQGIPKTDEGYYLIEQGYGEDMYFALTDDAIVFANDAAMVVAALAGKTGEGDQIDAVKELAGEPAFLYIDMNALDAETLYEADIIDYGDKAMFEMFGGAIEAIVASGSVEGGELKIRMKNKDENSLLAILKFAEKAAMGSM